MPVPRRRISGLLLMWDRPPGLSVPFSAACYGSNTESVIRINLLKSPSAAGAGKGDAGRPPTQWISTREAVAGGVLLGLAVGALLYLAGNRTIYRTGAPPATKTAPDQERPKQAEANPAPKGKIEATKALPAPAPEQGGSAARSQGAVSSLERPKQPKAAVAEIARSAEAAAPSTLPGVPAAGDSSLPASRFHLSQVLVQPGSEGVTVALRVEPGVAYRTMTLDNPSRVVIDFPDCRLAASISHSWPVTASPVHDVRISQFKVEPPIVRMVLDVASIPKYEIHPNSTGLEIRVAGGRP